MTENEAIGVAVPSDSSQQRNKTKIPNRRGSEYIDVLLRNLDEQLLRNSGSVIIGMAACQHRQGLTTTAINLAIRSADHGMGPVLLIDANVKNGKLSRIHRAGKVGYGDCLAGTATLKSAVTATKIQSLDILGIGNRQVAGQIAPDPTAAAEFFAQVRDQYQVAIVDMPIFKNPSPAHALGTYLDGMIAVVRSGVHQDRLVEMQSSIGNVNNNLLGVVMTGGEGNVMPRWLQRLFD